MEFKPTFAATVGRTFAIPIVGMPAFRTLLRGVPGIHKENMLSESFCFVPDKLLKLVERPVVELSVELRSSSLLNSDLAQGCRESFSVRPHRIEKEIWSP